MERHHWTITFDIDGIDDEAEDAAVDYADDLKEGMGTRGGGMLSTGTTLENVTVFEVLAFIQLMAAFLGNDLHGVTFDIDEESEQDAEEQASEEVGLADLEQAMAAATGAYKAWTEALGIDPNENVDDDDWEIPF